MVLKDSGYTTEQNDFAIRRSLTGSAARIVMYQGPDKPLSDILETLVSVYGSVENKQQLLSEFYGARQREDEDITAWSGRLEKIIGKGLEKGIVRQNEVNSMLHLMLWTGLRQELYYIISYIILYYPILSHLAKLYLGIPASSVSSEIMFSSAGDITAQSHFKT